MSLSPAMDSPTVDEIDSVRMNLNNDFTDIFEEKKDAASETLPVFIRIRPMLPQELSLGYSDCLTVFDNCIVRASAPENSAKFRHMDRVQDFTFTHVFQPDVNQLSLFEETMNNAVKGFIEGQNTLLFAYGSSGSGKTYTMLGNEKEPGIIPLTIQLFFQCVEGKQVPYVSFRPLNACEVIQLDPSEIAMQVEEKEKLLLSYNEDMDNTKASCSSIGGFDVTRISDAVLQELSTLPSFSQLENTCRNYLDFQGIYHYSCWVSFMELYNERIYDLFKPFTKKKRQVLPLGEDSDGNIFVKGLKEIHVSSISEVLRLLRLGKKNLNIATTKLNYQSSRSHCIFNIKVIRVLDPKSPSKVFVNTLSFCDLAGSERCGKTQNTGMRLKEASNINASLMVLGRCIEMLRQNQTLKEKKLIPFRESKLTRLFSSFFTGKGKASMIVNVSPSSHTFDETSNVLKFSALAQQVTMKEGTFRQELSRFTDFITSDRLSISSTRDSMAEDLDYSNLLDEREAMIKELCDVVENLKEELGKHMAENAKFENRIRSQLKEEYMEYYSETREFYNKRMEELRQNYRKRSERRFKTLLQSIRADSVKESSSSEDEDDVDGIVSDSELFANKDQTPSSSDNAKDAGTSSMNILEKEILALKTKVQQQEIKLAASGEALDEAKIELLSRSKIIEDCNLRISELERISTTMEKEKAASMENFGDLKKDLAVKTEALSTAQSEMSKLEDALSAANTKLESFENVLETNQGLTSQISELQDKIMEQNDKLAGFENMRATNQGLTSQIAELQDKIMEQAGKLTDRENSIRSLQDKLQSNTSEVKKELLTVEQELCESRNKEKDLRATIEAKEKEMLSKDERILDLENVSKSLESELKEKDETVRKHETAINNTALDIEKKDGELAGLRKKADTLDTKLNEAQQEVEQLDTRLRREAAASLRQEQRIQELQNLLNVAENRLNTAKSSVDCASQQTEPMQFEHQISTLEKVRRATEENLAKTQNEVKELQAVLITKSQEIVTVKETYEELKSNFESMQLELEDTKQMIKSKNDECLSKSADLAKEREKYSELERAVALKEEQLKLKQENLTKVQVELLAKVEELSKNHSELQKSDSLKDKEIKTKEETLKEIQEGLNEKLKDLSKKYSELQEVATSKDKEIKMKEDMLKKVQEDLNGKIEDLNKKYSELQKMATSKDKEIKMKEDTLKEVQEGLNGKLKDLSKKYSELQETANSKDKEMKMKEDALKEIQEGLNGQLKDLSKKYSDLQETATSKDKEIKMKEDTLKKIQADLNGKIEDLSKKYSDLQETATSNDNEVGTQSELIKELNQKIESLNSAVLEQESNSSKTGEILLQKQKKIESLMQKISQLEAEKEGQSIVEAAPKVPSIEIEVQTDQNSEKLLEDKQIETDVVHEIERNQNALKDQKELEQAERDLCKKEYETEIQKLKTIKESLEAENKKIKEELEENKKLNEELAKFKEKFETEENKEFVKVEVQPEIEAKPEFLKPKGGRTRRTKILQNSDQVSAEDLEATSNEENGSVNVKSTRSKRRSSPDIKDTTELSLPPPKPKASQRRKKAFSLDLAKESLANGSADSESKTDTSENTSPKPKLRGKRKLSQPLEQPTRKENVTDDIKPKDEEILEPPPVKSRAVTRKKFSFDQSNNSDADFEPKSKTSKRITRTTSSVSVNEEPKKPARSTRVVRKRSARTAEDEEDKEAPKVKATRGRLAEQTKKDVVDESPLRRIRNFVSEAVPKIKSAAEHVTSMLSPTVARKEMAPPVSSTQRKGGRLFKKDPFLAALSPVEKEEEPVEKKTRGRQPRKTKK